MNRFTRRRFIRQAAALSGGLGYVAGGGQLRAADRSDIDPDALTRLQKSLKGRLVLPGDSMYEGARRVFYWNPKIEQTPTAIVQCQQEEDVVRAVEFARQHGLEIAVRSGGHSHLAWGSSNGLVIDLSPLKRITVDPDRRVVSAQAGVTSGEVARAAGKFGLVPVLGQCPGVSATGVTLGGGLGWLSGLYGAACDNLLLARLVTAAAESREVNAETDADLFWGLRGAGANFGVTTSFEARLHRLDAVQVDIDREDKTREETGRKDTLGNDTVLGGDVHFAAGDARAVLRGFRDLMSEAPDGFQATLNLTPGERGCFISLCHAGQEREREQILRTIRSIATPTREAVNRRAFADLAEKPPATNSSAAPPPQFRAIQTVYRDRITDEIIDIYVDQLAHATPDLIFGLSHYMHGEVCRVDPAATAFPHRAAHSIHLRAAYSWSRPETDDKRFAWGENWLSLLRPKSNEQLYANYQTYETQAGSPSLFGRNYSRLLALKNKLDPENVFHRNANIAAARL